MTPISHIRLGLTLAASLLACAAAQAQPAAKASAPATPSAKAPSRGEAQALQLFNMLDANGDGRISRAEAEVAIRIKPSLAELFERTDTNHDGYLTQGEIRAEAARQKAERQARAGAMSRP